jgi:hypothetical protein
MMTALSIASAAAASFDPTLLLAWFTCLATLAGGIFTVLRYGRRIMTMVEDFNGTKSRPGVPPRPGVMERLQGVETQMTTITAEITPNHGGSMKDAISRIDVKVITLETDIQGIHERLDAPSSAKVVEVNVHP